MSETGVQARETETLAGAGKAFRLWVWSTLTLDSQAAAFFWGAKNCKGISQKNTSPALSLPFSWKKKPQSEKPTLSSWRLSTEFQGTGYFYYSCILIVCREDDFCWINRKERRLEHGIIPENFADLCCWLLDGSFITTISFSSLHITSWLTQLSQTFPQTNFHKVWATLPSHCADKSERALGRGASPAAPQDGYCPRARTHTGVSHAATWVSEGNQGCWNLWKFASVPCFLQCAR